MSNRLVTRATAMVGGALLAGAMAAEPAIDRGSFAFGGRTLNYFCGGEGSPTLILEAPSGISNEEGYANILADLVAGYRFCAYERAAYGGSEPLAPGVVQTVSDYAEELGALLSLAEVAPPYVLIGFSYGGFVSRYYTAHNPQQVVGMVLIDSPHVKWLRTMKDEMSADDWTRVEEIMQWFLDNRGHDVWESQFEVEAAPALPPDLPLVVITRVLDNERMRLSGISEAGFRIYNDTHYRLAPELLELTDRTHLITAHNSEHMIPETEPEVVMDAIETLLQMVRASGR